MDINQIKVEILKNLSYAGLIPMSQEGAMDTVLMYVNSSINHITLLNKPLAQELRKKVDELFETMRSVLADYRYPPELDEINREIHKAQYHTAVYSDFRDDVNELISERLADSEIIP